MSPQKYLLGLMHDQKLMEPCYNVVPVPLEE